MPSRVKLFSIDIAVAATPVGLAWSLSNPYAELVRAGHRVTQIAVITLPSTAVGKVGLRIGADGDAIRLNGQGQVITLDGTDSTNGIWVVFMPNLGDPDPTGVVEFALGDAKT